MNELIRKWDAIYAVEKADWYHINKRGELVKGANSQKDDPLYKAKDVYDALENVKPVIISRQDAATKWTPVHEELPKEEGYFLVTDEAAGMVEILVDKYICCDDGEWTWLYSQHAIAWMPLPEPWKGEADV